MAGEQAFDVVDRAMAQSCKMLLALDLWLGPTHEIALLGDAAAADMQTVLADLRRRFLPRKLVAQRPGTSAHRASSLDALFSGKTPGAEPVAYICENFACQLPTSDPGRFAELLG